MNNQKEIHDALSAQKYEKDGYKVYIEPEASNLPLTWVHIALAC